MYFDHCLSHPAVLIYVKSVWVGKEKTQKDVRKNPEKCQAAVSGTARVSSQALSSLWSSEVRVSQHTSVSQWRCIEMAPKELRIT